jgi:hypothetical protein
MREAAGRENHMKRAALAVHKRYKTAAFFFSFSENPSGECDFFRMPHRHKRRGSDIGIKSMILHGNLGSVAKERVSPPVYKHLRSHKKELQ